MTASAARGKTLAGHIVERVEAALRREYGL